MKDWEQKALLAYPSFNGYIDKNMFAIDIRRVHTTIKMCQRYHASGEINHKLILNNLVILANIFDIDVMTEAFTHETPEEIFPIIHSFFIFLKFCQYSDDANQPIIDMLNDMVNRY